MIIQVILDMRAFLALLFTSTLMFAVIWCRLFNGIELTIENENEDNSFGKRTWDSYNLVIGEFGDLKGEISTYPGTYLFNLVTIF